MCVEDPGVAHQRSDVLMAEPLTREEREDILRRNVGRHDLVARYVRRWNTTVEAVEAERDALRDLAKAALHLARMGKTADVVDILRNALEGGLS